MTFIWGKIFEQNSKCNNHQGKIGWIWPHKNYVFLYIQKHQ